jgi:UDP-N-acetylglucosamine 2-epimerase (non-hydrolysing)
MAALRKKMLFCFGTRPEAIKLAPVIEEFSKRSRFDVRVCVTSQHREMLDQVIDLFGITPDYDLDLMRPDQTLEKLTGAVVASMCEILAEERPDCVIVQGDTTTTFACSLAAYYKRISVVHVEAGLRTYNKFAPFPEEMNRQMTSRLADWHFSPTMRASKALRREGVPRKQIFMVGNTVIDALLSVVEKARANDGVFRQRLNTIAYAKRILLVTGHRRENFGRGLRDICHALRLLAETDPRLDVVYPVHRNPNVQEPVRKLLSGVSNIHLIPPQDYLTFVWLLDRSHIVLTDSGGVQEEAPSLGKPVLVTRDNTERPEAVEAGVARLVGTDPGKIVAEVQQLLHDERAYKAMSRAQNPYGDGTSSRQIADVLVRGLTTPVTGPTNRVKSFGKVSTKTSVPREVLNLKEL